MYDYLEVIRSPRHALQVERWHTWPTLRTQTIGDHTAQVLRIYVEVFGPPSPVVTLRILRHDMGEIGTGDCPSYAKVKAPELKNVLDKIEETVLNEMGHALSHLESAEAARVHCCDALEALEFAVDEMRLGSSFGAYIWKTMTGVFSQRCADLATDEDRRVVGDHYRDLMLRRPSWMING